MNTMEMMVARVMNDPAAATIDIPASADPTALADLYCRVSTHDDPASRSHALAIEAHLRTFATVHFHVPEVMEALARIERHRDALPGRLRS